MLVQTLCVLILSIPLPSNTLRGFIVKGYKQLWARSAYVRGGCITIFALQLLAFGDAMRSLNHLEEHEYTGHLGDVINYNKMLRNQRNAYITGFGMFMGFVCFRLLNLMTQLYEQRQINKEHIKEEKEKLSQSGNKKVD